MFSVKPVQGNLEKGYFGKVSNICTNTELVNLVGMTDGVLLDPASTDITFHKFVHKGRILYIPNRPIKHSISWDMIQAKDCVKGKVVTIKGKDYLVRLMTGSVHYSTGKDSVAGGEWDDLFLNFHTSKGGTLTDADVYVTGNGNYTWCQEVHSNALTQRVYRGYGSVSSFDSGNSYNTGTHYGWRPVFEEL